MNPDTPDGQILAKLFQTLHEYLEAVLRQKLPSPPDILSIFARLDELEAQLDARHPANLRHYMHQKSYRKAYLFLKNQDIENTRGKPGR
jgi:hypothetical protein